MALDPYEPCPCGSGKKLKFCCAGIVPAMEQVSRLQQSGQYEASLKKLEELAAKHPGNHWIIISRATVLLNTDRPAQARDELRELLQANADNQLALVLYASAAFNADKFEASRPAIHRCFQKCVRQYPDFVAGLALGIAGEMAIRQKYMAARQHLAFAMRISSEEDRQEVFVRLHDFDSDHEISYPLRSVHLLSEVELEGDDAKDVDKARRLNDIGCWGPAAKVYAQLAEKHPDHPELLRNLGLCRAWDGDQAGAAEALHQAARLMAPEFGGVECETIAQLLDLDNAEDQVGIHSWSFPITSVSQTLTRLGTEGRLVKLPLNEDDENATGLPSAFYQVLDRSPEGITLTADSPLDDVPRVLAHLSVYDRDTESDTPPTAYCSGFAGDDYEEARKFVSEILSDFLTDQGAEDTSTGDSVAAEERALFWRWAFPAETPTIVRRRLEQRKWDEIIEQRWKSLPLRALGGKTPQQAADAGDQLLQLLAAVYVLDAFCSRNQYVMDFAGVCQSLGLEVPEPVSVTDKTPITHFSAMQLKRVDVKTLADEQLVYVSNRAMLLHHGAFLYDVLEELLERPGAAQRVDVNQVLLTLVDLSVERFRRDLAFSWIERANAWCQEQDNSFQLILQWKLRELSLRVEDPDDERLKPLFTELRDRYGKKVPELRPYLNMIATAYRLPDLQDSSLVTPDAGAAGGLWTPESEAAPTGEGQKLWLPGQE